MLRFVLNSLRGRRRETLFLSLVLTLSFAFSTLMAVLFPSTQQQMQRDREETYGGWQLLLYDQAGTMTASMTAAAEALGAEALCLETAGHTQEGSQVAVMDEELDAMGNFTLLEGRWPQAEDELLIVAGAFRPEDELAVGDEVTLSYVWDNIYNEASRSVQEAGGERMAAVQEALQEQWESYYPAFREFWDKGGWERFHLGEEYQVPAEQLTGEQALYAASVWAMNNIGAFDVITTTTHRPNLTSEGLVLREDILKHWLRGAGFGERHNTTIESSDYEDLILRKTYRICGVLQSYEGTWDLGGYDMPDAFLSEAGSAKVASLLAGVQEEYPDLRFRPASETLLLRGEMSAAALYEALLPAYEAARPDSYRVELYAENSGGSRGVLVGRDRDSGELVCLELALDGDDVSLRFQSRTYTASLSDMYAGRWRIDGLEPLAPEIPTLAQLYERNSYPFRLNTAAWPREDGTARAYAQNAMALTLTVLSGCAVLTVCMIQKKKRVRSLLTLKAIGMENRQGAAMLTLEGGLFWAFALPPGMALGLGAAWYYLSAQSTAPVLALDGAMLLGSLGGVTAAVTLGFALPLFTAMSLPLTGKVTEKPGRPPRRSRPGRSYLSLEREKNRYHRRKDLAVRALACLMVFAALLTLTLSHQAYADYRGRVERAGRPDVVFSASYGMSKRYWREKTEEISLLAEEWGAESVQTYLAAEDVLLSCAAFENDSPILSYEREHEEASRFAANESGESCYITDVLGVTADSSLLAALSEVCTEGAVDLQSLEEGTGCILLLPMYRERGDELQLSFDAGLAPLYEADTAVAVGDTLTLSAESHKALESGWTSSWKETSLTVQAIIRCFPEEGIWPFAGEPQGYVLVAGAAAVRELYPKASARPNGQNMALQELIQQLHCGSCDGKTYFQLSFGETVPDDTALWNLAQKNQYHMSNYRSDNAAIEQVCAFQRVMTLLLGTAAQLLLLTILGFLVFDRVEQERRRIGILRSLGLSRGQMLGGQTLLAALRSAEICLLGNAAAALVWLAAALAGGARRPAQVLSYTLQSFLWKYPWAVHGLVCALLWLLLAVLFLIPYIRSGKQTIIEMTREQEGR